MSDCLFLVTQLTILDDLHEIFNTHHLLTNHLLQSITGLDVPQLVLQIETILSGFILLTPWWWYGFGNRVFEIAFSLRRQHLLCVP